LIVSQFLDSWLFRWEHWNFIFGISFRDEQ
jgi:hypothetical protein